MRERQQHGAIIEIVHEADLLAAEALQHLHDLGAGLARFFDGADEQGPDDRMHDGSGEHHPGTARAGSHEPRQIASHSGPETKSSPSTAARLRLFNCRTSPARTTGIAVEKTRRMQITVQRMRPWLPRAAHHIAGPIHFLCTAFSTYTRVITDVAIFRVRGRRRWKYAD